MPAHRPIATGFQLPAGPPLTLARGLLLYLRLARLDSAMVADHFQGFIPTALWERFEGRIFSAEEVPAGKPAPDLFLRAAGMLGADPEATLVVEPGRHVVAAAGDAGASDAAGAGG